MKNCQAFETKSMQPHPALQNTAFKQSMKLLAAGRLQGTSSAGACAAAGRLCAAGRFMETTSPD